MPRRLYGFPSELAALVLCSCAIASATANTACGGSSSTSPTTTTTTTAATTNTSTLTVSTTAVTFAANTGPGATQPVTLTNSGTEVPVVMTSVVASGNYSQSNDCGASIAVGASCTVTVTFVPISAGNSGLLTITDDASTSPQTVTLSGPTVLAPSAVLAPSTLNFGTQAIGTTSAVQTLTLTNPVNAISVALAVSTSSITGNDFAVAQNGCQQPVPPGGSCTFSLTFTPSAAGPRSALFAVFDNAVTPSQSVTLTGSGQ